MFDPNTVAESAVFKSLRLRAFQTLEDFHSKIMEKSYHLQKPERDLIIKFVNELLHQLTFFVRTISLRSFKDTLQQTKLGEPYVYQTDLTAVAAVRIKETSNHIQNDADDHDRLD